MEVFPDYPRNTTDLVREEIPTPVMSDEIWKLILDRSRIPETIIHMLKGEVWIVKDNNGQLVGSWEKRGEALMNDRGIRFFTPLLYSAITPDKLTTFITEEETNRMVKDMMESIIEVIWERGDEFEIPASNRSYVCRMIEHYYFLSLTSSRKGTILNALKPAYERKEVYSPNPRPGKFKMPSFLGGGP